MKPEIYETLTGNSNGERMKAVKSIALMIDGAFLHEAEYRKLAGALPAAISMEPDCREKGRLLDFGLKVLGRLPEAERESYSKACAKAYAVSVAKAVFLACNEENQKKLFRALEKMRGSIGAGMVDPAWLPILAETVASILEEGHSVDTKEIFAFVGREIIRGFGHDEYECYNAAYCVLSDPWRQEAVNEKQKIAREQRAFAPVVVLGCTLKRQLDGKISLTETVVSRIERSLTYAAENAGGDVQKNAIQFLRHSASAGAWKSLGRMIDTSPGTPLADLAKESLRLAGERTNVRTGLFARVPPSWLRPIARMAFEKGRKEAAPLIRA